MTDPDLFGRGEGLLTANRIAAALAYQAAAVWGWWPWEWLTERGRRK